MRPEQSFQSTLPVRGATVAVYAVPAYHLYFNPRSPCGERPIKSLRFFAMSYFNPRSPCGERLFQINLVHGACRFQSTLPVRGATGASFSLVTNWLDFNPRSPCGERRFMFSILTASMSISIHAPRAGSDNNGLSIKPNGLVISIHAPRAGSD